MMVIVVVVVVAVLVLIVVVIVRRLVAEVVAMVASLTPSMRSTPLFQMAVSGVLRWRPRRRVPDGMMAMLTMMAIAAPACNVK